MLVARNPVWEETYGTVSWILVPPKHFICSSSPAGPTGVGLAANTGRRWWVGCPGSTSLQPDQSADDIEKRKRQRQKKAREERRRERRIEIEENKKQGKCKFRNSHLWLVLLYIIVWNSVWDLGARP